MAYYITNSDTTVSITIPEGVIDTSSYSVSLVGRNVSNYGQYFAENALRLLENFASEVAPSAQNLLIGQLWYDKEKQIIRVWDGATWKSQTGITIENSIPGSDELGTFTPPQPGTALFNREDLKLYVYDDAQDTRPWAASYAGEVSSRYSDMLTMGQPTQYGSRVRNIYLLDSNGVYRAVTAIIYNSNSNGFNEGDTSTRFGRETIIAIFSDHEPFQPANGISHTEGEDVNYFSELSLDVQGIARRQDGFIRPGLNLRDYPDQASVPKADVAGIAESALSISYVSGGPNTVENYFDLENGVSGATGTIVDILGDDIHTTWRDVNPDLDDNRAIGDTNLRYSSINVIELRSDVLQAGSDNNGTANSSATGNIIGQWTVPVGSNLIVQGGLNVSNLEITDLTVNNQLTTDTITTGGSAIPGTITGTWILTAGSTLQATYADLAEKYASDQAYTPGTVVKLGGIEEITSTTSLGDTDVFGVVSTDPAFVMNQALVGGLAVALAGRVPVNVIGTINKGDRLVSSEIPGVAVALNHTDLDYDPRMIIGRSLETNNHSGLKQVEAVVGVK